MIESKTVFVFGSFCALSDNSISIKDEEDMNRKISYRTKWQDEILRYFREISNGHVTASDVYEYFRGEGYTIGMTTVYRQLDNLVSLGKLNKYNIETGCPACYEYIEQDNNENNKVCFHCKCENCGKLIHIHCNELKEIQKHFIDFHDFFLDSKRTVFYGVCSDCRKKEVTDID